MWKVWYWYGSWIYPNYFSCWNDKNLWFYKILSKILVPSISKSVFNRKIKLLFLIFQIVIRNRSNSFKFPCKKTPESENRKIRDAFNERVDWRMIRAHGESNFAFHDRSKHPRLAVRRFSREGREHEDGSLVPSWDPRVEPPVLGVSSLVPLYTYFQGPSCDRAHSAQYC